MTRQTLTFTGVIAIAAVAAPAPSLLAQQSVAIDLTGVRIQNGRSEFRSSAPDTISPSDKYHYEIDGMVRGSGIVLGALFPEPVPLAQAMETLAPGSSESLSGYVHNCEGTHPFGISGYSVAGTTELLGTTVNYAMTLSTGIDGDDIAFFSLTDVVLTPALLVGSLTFTSGSATITRACYANCDNSTGNPALNIDDFLCFINAFAAGDEYANCNCSTSEPVLNIDDFLCFIDKFATGCW